MLYPTTIQVPKPEMDVLSGSTNESNLVNLSKWMCTNLSSRLSNESAFVSK